MDSQEGTLIALLEQKVGRGVSAAQVAATVAAMWRHAEEGLVPVIGPQGVVALYQRSLLLTSRAHPWLAGLGQIVPQTVDLEGLTAALAQQESIDAARAGGELLQTFHGLVNGLIGSSLTRRLLRHMWQTF